MDITDEKAVLYYQAIHGLVDKASIALIGCILVGTALIILALVIASVVSIGEISSGPPSTVIAWPQKF